MKRFFSFLFCILIFFSGCTRGKNYFANISTYEKACPQANQALKSTSVLPNIPEIADQDDDNNVQRSLVVYNAGTQKKPILKALAVFSDESIVDVSDKVVWKSLDPDVLEFDKQNHLTPKKNSLARVSAVYEDFTTITDPFPVVYNEMDLKGVSRISIGTEANPDTSEFLFRTYKQQLRLKALAHFNNNFVMDITQFVNWKSYNSFIASVDEHGLLTAEGTGFTSMYVVLNDDFIFDENNSVLLGSFNAIVNIPGEKEALIVRDDGGSVVDNKNSPSLDIVFPHFSIPEETRVELREITAKELPLAFNGNGVIVKAFFIQPEGVALTRNATVNVVDRTFSTLKHYQVFFLSTLKNSYVPVDIQTVENGKIVFPMEKLGYWIVIEDTEELKPQKIKRATPQNSVDSLDEISQDSSLGDFFLELHPESSYRISCDDPSVNVYLKAPKSADWVAVTFRELKKSFMVRERTATFANESQKQIYEEKLYLFKDEIFVRPYEHNLKRDELQDGIYHIDIHASTENGFFSSVLPVQKKCAPLETDFLEKIQLVAVEDPSAVSLSAISPLNFLQEGESIAVVEQAIFSDGTAYPLRAVFPDVTFFIEDKKFADYVTYKYGAALKVKTMGETAFWVKAGGLCSEKIPLIVKESDSVEKKKNFEDSGAVAIRGIETRASVAYLYDTKPIQLQAYYVSSNKKDEENVTDKVEWTAKNPEVCDVDKQGLLKAVGNGRGWIDALYKGRVARNGFFCIVTLNKDERATIQKGSHGRITTKNDVYSLTVDIQTDAFEADTEVVPHILTLQELPEQPLLKDPIIAVFSIEPYDVLLQKRAFVSLNFKEWPLPYEEYNYWFYNQVRKEYFPVDAFISSDYQGNNLFLGIDGLGYFIITGKNESVQGR